MNGSGQHYGTTNRKNVFHDTLKYGNYPVVRITDIVTDQNGLS